MLRGKQAAPRPSWPSSFMGNPGYAGIDLVPADGSCFEGEALRPKGLSYSRLQRPTIKDVACSDRPSRVTRAHLR